MAQSLKRALFDRTHKISIFVEGEDSCKACVPGRGTIFPLGLKILEEREDVFCGNVLDGRLGASFSLQELEECFESTGIGLDSMYRGSFVVREVRFQEFLDPEVQGLFGHSKSFRGVSNLSANIFPAMSMKTGRTVR
jgi:hypothetical protein